MTTTTTTISGMPTCAIQAPNRATFSVNGAQFHFSYRTCIAFQAPDGPMRVMRNYWGPTTGKHLNAIDGGDKSGRLSRDDFQAAFAADFNV